MYGNNIIRISYLDKDPQKTQLVTKTMTGILVEENMRTQTKEADVAIGFIKEQLEVYKKKIKEAEVADLEEQLKKLLVDSTEQHPMVKELRQKLAIAKKELESGDYKVAVSKTATDSPAYEAMKKELDKLVSEESANLEGSLAYAYQDNGSNRKDANNAIYKLMLMDKLDTTLARDKNVNEMIYNMLLQKLETAKITQRLEASKQGTRYTVIDPPRLPLKAAKPNKIKIVFLGMLLGCGSGTGLVFGREFMDQSFLDIEDAKANLEFPVLGGISRITTQEEINREKFRRRKQIILTLLGSAALIIAAMLIYLFRK
jgi:LPS O-antigen subunit length determinant protein (WzzB/FepE family)